MLLRSASKGCVFIQTVDVSSGRISLQAANIPLPVKLGRHRGLMLSTIFLNFPSKELPLVSLSSRPQEAEIVFLF